MNSERKIEVAAGVLVINGRNEVLLVKRSTDAHVAPGQWTRPTGKVEFGETGEHAAVRETLEETDVVVEIPDTTPLTTWDSINPKKATHCVVREYVGTYVSGEARNAEPDKHDDVRWFPLTALPEGLSVGTQKAIALLPTT